MQTPTLSRMPVQVLTPPQQQAQPVYEITKEDRDRQERIRLAWQAYDGELEKPLVKMPGEADDNVMPNRCAPITDDSGDFLFGKELGIACEEGAPAEAQVLLDATWGIKEVRIPLLMDLHMNGSIAGRAFLRIVPSKDKPGRPKTYRLVTVDPSIVFVQSAPQDCETVLLYCIEYSTTEKRDGRDVQVYYREEMQRIDPDGNALKDQPDDDDTWIIQHWSQIGQMGMQPKLSGWTPAGEPIVWPYPFPPLFSCKNLPRANDFWGKPDITKSIIGLNNALNLDLSNANRDGKIGAQPIVWVKGVGGSTVDIKPGKALVLPPTPESGMGAVKIEANIPALLQLAADVRSDTDEESGVPGVATGRISTMPRGNLSGIAIELLFMPLLKRTDKKRCLYGKLILDVCKALFVLAGLHPDIKVELAWESPLPHDDLPAVQAAISKLEVGVSKTSLLRELGYDPDEEAELNDAEDVRKLAKQQASGLSTIVALPPAVPGTKPIPGQEPGKPGTPDTGAARGVAPAQPSPVAPVKRSAGRGKKP